MHDSRRGDTYQIGELAARSGVTPDTLRYYERLGLLPQPGRTRGGFRVYRPETIERIRFVKQAQTLGLTLDEIRDLVSYQDRGGLKRCRSVRDLLRAKLAAVQARLAELQEFQSTLIGYLQQCERSLNPEREVDRDSDPDCPVIEILKTK
jgi:DNA-binding transcriptional MerR regulator